jgi:hypothetical protein
MFNHYRRGMKMRLEMCVRTTFAADAFRSSENSLKANGRRKGPIEGQVYRY